MKPEQIKAVPISWIRQWESRLDCGPYMSGAIEARELLKRMKTAPLVTLTRNGIKGMYHVGMDKLRWVDDPNAGVPFLRSSDILKADLSGQPYISSKQVAGNALFQCPEGATLITRSGAIGRMAYARSDLANVAISQDVLKVVPNSSAIRPGYLYAFLSSNFGIPQITSGTFGSIIVHIEAENIADLPVPRLGETIERKVDELVEKAAEKRVRATQLLAQAQSDFLSLLGKSPSISSRLWNPVRSIALLDRCDAYYFSPKCMVARKWFDSAECEGKSIGEVASVTIPGIFKRLYATDPQFGVPYITGGDVFELAPATNRYLMKRVAKEYGLQVSRGMILIQEAGQLGGLIGRSVQVGSHLDGFAVSNNMIRVFPKDETDAGYIYVVLSSEPGITLIAREAAGSSIPHLDAGRVRQLVIPWATPATRRKIGILAIEARDLRDRAIEHDRQARELVEKAIEEAA